MTDNIEPIPPPLHISKAWQDTEQGYFGYTLWQYVKNRTDPDILLLVGLVAFVAGLMIPRP